MHGSWLAMPNMPGSVESSLEAKGMEKNLNPKLVLNHIRTFITSPGLLGRLIMRDKIHVTSIREKSPLTNSQTGHCQILIYFQMSRTPLCTGLVCGMRNKVEESKTISQPTITFRKLKSHGQGRQSAFTFHRQQYSERWLCK